MRIPATAGSGRGGTPLSGGEATAILRRCGFFTGVAEPILEQLAALAELLEIPSGATLFEKGDVGTAMYFVLHGNIRVHHGEVVVGRAGAGDVFGEVAALSGEMRTASVTAESDTRLLVLEKQSIYSVLDAQPAAARALIEALCARERQIIDEKLERVVAGRVLERELEIGQRIQQHFLPESIPQPDGWRLHGLLRPARKVAGDFYDYFAVPGCRRVGVVIGDVCDKGVGAALFMTLFRSLLRSGVLTRCASAPAGVAVDPSVLLRHALGSTNDYVASTHGSSSMFASVFFGLLDPASGDLHYINAGHEPPVIVTADGIRAQLETTGPVIGLFEALEHRVEAVRLMPGEALFGYTDGATDARNESGLQFSEERLLAESCRAVAGSVDPLERLLASVEAFTGGAEQFDDITMICIQRQH
jgi:serine phosphatase RsbU (regulator of sigma subunit)